MINLQQQLKWWRTAQKALAELEPRRSPNSLLRKRTGGVVQIPRKPIGLTPSTGIQCRFLDTDQFRCIWTVDPDPKSPAVEWKNATTLEHGTFFGIFGSETTITGKPSTQASPPFVLSHRFTARKLRVTFTVPRYEIGGVVLSPFQQGQRGLGFGILCPSGPLKELRFEPDPDREGEVLVYDVATETTSGKRIVLIFDGVATDIECGNWVWKKRETSTRAALLSIRSLQNESTLRIRTRQTPRCIFAMPLSAVPLPMTFEVNYGLSQSQVYTLDFDNPDELFEPSLFRQGFENYKEFGGFVWMDEGTQWRQINNYNNNVEIGNPKLEGEFTLTVEAIP